MNQHKLRVSMSINHYKNSDLCETPSTNSSIPVTKLLSSDARKETAFAISSGL